MRRTEREITGLDDILGVLHRCEVLRLGLCDKIQPYIVPMNFAFETVDNQIFIYLHCAREGRKIDIITKNNKVCFEADCAYKTIPGDIACRWSAEFESVIGEGVISILCGEEQIISGLDLLMKRYGFPGKPQYSPQALSAVTVLRIAVTSITGKRKINNPK